MGSHDHRETHREEPCSWHKHRFDQAPGALGSGDSGRHRDRIVGTGSRQRPLVGVIPCFSYPDGAGGCIVGDMYAHDLGKGICGTQGARIHFDDGRVHTYIIGMNHAIWNVINYAGSKRTSGWRSLEGWAQLEVRVRWAAVVPNNLQYLDLGFGLGPVLQQLSRWLDGLVRVSVDDPELATFVQKVCLSACAVRRSSRTPAACRTSSC